MGGKRNKRAFLFRVLGPLRPPLLSCMFHCWRLHLPRGSTAQQPGKGQNATHEPVSGSISNQRITSHPNEEAGRALGFVVSSPLASLSYVTNFRHSGRSLSLSLSTIKEITSPAATAMILRSRARSPKKKSRADSPRVEWR